MKIQKLKLFLLIYTLFLINFALAQNSYHDDACTDIIVGKLASVDGSVITSHTGCCAECRVHVVPAKIFKKARKFLTEYTTDSMEKVIQLYKELRELLITKYTNNKQRL